MEDDGPLNTSLRKLTDDQVLEIRKRHARGDVTQTQLALEYDVSRQLIGKAIYGHQWTHESPDVVTSRPEPGRDGVTTYAVQINHLYATASFTQTRGAKITFVLGDHTITIEQKGTT